MGLAKKIQRKNSDSKIADGLKREEERERGEE
jgi:hypothetical protein